MIKAILTAIITLAPIFSSPIKRLFDMAFAWIEERRKQRAEKELSDAIEKSRRSKNTSDLDGSF